MPTLFISDLHLCPERPGVTALFQHFLAKVGGTASALYILGDLFEYWAGDDDLSDAHHAAVAAALAEAAAQGTALYLMHGNRDFLLGDSFAQAASLTLIDDPTVIDLYGTPTLLCHGDTLCSDDRDYLALREKIRNPAWIAGFLAQPLALRKAQIEQMREHSESEKQRKDYALMDANQDAIAAALHGFACSRLIHGHTHHPAHHRHRVADRPCERWVLPAWEDNPGYLRCDRDGCTSVRING